MHDIYLCHLSKHSFDKKRLIFKSFKTLQLKLTKFLIYYSTYKTQIELSEYTGIKIRTVFEIGKAIIKKIRINLEEKSLVFGGPGVVVNINESMFHFKAKSHRGRSPREQVYALAIVGTFFKPCKGYCVVVTYRTKQVLIPIILSHVRPGSIIHTDEFKSYLALRNENYELHQVFHKYNFVCPETGIYTQYVESYNNKIKMKIKEQKGVKKMKDKIF